MSARALALVFAIVAPIAAPVGVEGASVSSLRMPPLGDMSLRIGGGASKIAKAFRFCTGAYGTLVSIPRLARASLDDIGSSLCGVLFGVEVLGEFPASEGGADAIEYRTGEEPAFSHC